MILGYSVAIEVNQYNFIPVPFINLRNCKVPFDRMWFHLPKRHLRGFEQNKRGYCVSLHLRKSSIGKCVVARASIMPAHSLRSCKFSFTSKSKSSFYILKQFKIASFRSSLGSQSGRHPQGIAHARSLNSESFFNLFPTVVSLVSKKRELLERAWSIHWSINVAPRWIKQDRDQLKKIEDKICGMPKDLINHSLEREYFQKKYSILGVALRMRNSLRASFLLNFSSAWIFF